MKENSTSIEPNMVNEQILINNDKTFEELMALQTKNLFDVWKWLKNVYDYFDTNQQKKHWWQKIGQNKSKGMAHLKHVYEKNRLSYVGPMMEKMMAKAPSCVASYCFSELLLRVLESVEKGSNRAKTGYTKTPEFKKALSDNIDKLEKWQTKAADQMDIELGTGESLTKDLQSIFKNMNGQNIGKSIERIEDNLEKEKIKGGLAARMNLPQNAAEKIAFEEDK